MKPSTSVYISKLHCMVITQAIVLQADSEREKEEN